MTPTRRLGWTSLALVALVAGCGEPAPTTPTPASTPSTGVGVTPATPGTEGPKASTEVKPMPVPEEPKKDGAAVGKPLSDEAIAEIKKLPADEQPIALAQKVCPVSNDHLGEMGAPIKQVVGGRTFYLCCAGCEKAVKSNPDKVLADLANLKK